MQSGQLSCYVKCKIMTWSDNYISHEQDMFSQDFDLNHDQNVHY